MRTVVVSLVLVALAGCGERHRSADADTASTARALPRGGAAVGQWTAEQAAADSPARRFTLSLGADNGALLRTEHEGKGTVTEKGTWSADGKAVTIMLTDRDGKPISTFLAYDLLANQLVPTEGWDTTQWGALGPPRFVKR